MNNAEAARQAHDWLVNSGLYRDVIASAGAYDSKVEPAENASLAAHLLNATTVAVNSFVYEAFSPGDEITAYEEPIRVLAGATVLHDTNKYVREAYGAAVDGNTRAAFERYFDEGDDFGIEAFVGDEYREDLLYLVQRTEINEDSRETRRTTTEFRGLEQYTRLGDQAASIAQRDGIRSVYRRLAEEFGEHETHLVEFTEIEQPVLNELLIGAVKEVIDGDDGRSAPSGVVIGSTASAVVYLGDALDRKQLRERVSRRVSERILGEFDFSCKLNWQSFGYEGLALIEIDPSEKEQVIADAFRDLLVGDDETANREQFARIPDAFDQYFAPLVKALYVDTRSDFAEIDPEIQAEYDQLYDDVGGQKIKFYFVAHLVERYINGEDGTEAFLDQLAAETRPALHADMEPETDAVATVVERFFGGVAGADSDAEAGIEIGTPAPSSKDAMCYLCGAAAEQRYAKDKRAIHSTFDYSRRLPPHGEYKSICGPCNIEHALFEDICEQNGISPNNELEAAYFYFDDFLGDVRVRSRRVGSAIQDDTVDIDELDVSTSLVAPQYYIQPFRISGDNHRLSVVQQLLQTAQQSGMKVVISRPFTRFMTSDSVVVDQEATRPEITLGISEIERFGPLPEFAREGRDREPTHLRRAVHLLDVMSTIGWLGDITNPYLALDRDEFVEICSLAVRKAVRPSAQRKPSRPANLPETVRSYIETYHGDALMDMETIVRRGIELFGQDKYGSKHSKTRGFREALDVIMTGYGENADDERIKTDACGAVYAIAQREEYAGRTTPEQAERFVDAVLAYLREENLDDLAALSARQNALVDTYYYTHDKISFESDDAEAESDVETASETESGA